MSPRPGAIVEDIASTFPAPAGTRRRSSGGASLAHPAPFRVRHLYRVRARWWRPPPRTNPTRASLGTGDRNSEWQLVIVRTPQRPTISDFRSAHRQIRGVCTYHESTTFYPAERRRPRTRRRWASFPASRAPPRRTPPSKIVLDYAYYNPSSLVLKNVRLDGGRSRRRRRRGRMGLERRQQQGQRVPALRRDRLRLDRRRRRAAGQGQRLRHQDRLPLLPAGVDRAGGAGRFGDHRGRGARRARRSPPPRAPIPTSSCCAR